MPLPRRASERVCCETSPAMSTIGREILVRGQSRLEEVTRLNVGATDLQVRSVRVGFGGLAHHIAEFTRLLSSGVEGGRLRAQLGIVSDLLEQARLTLSPEERASRPLDGGAAALGGLAPPPLVTVARAPSGPPPITVHTPSAQPALPAQAASAPPQPPPRLDGSAPAAPRPFSPPPVRPSSPLPAHPPGQSLPASPPVAQFGVKSMLGLRAFGSGPRPEPNRSPLLGLRSPQAAAKGSVRPSAPPPMVAPDASGLPPLGRSSAKHSDPPPLQSDFIKQRLRSSERNAPPQKPAPRQGGRGRPRPDAGRGGLWVALAAAVVLLGVVFGGLFLLLRRPARPTVVTGTGPGPSAAVVDPAHPRKNEVELPRERLLADDERFTALLAQVHGHGGTESPELRSLLNEQAALASKALAGKCNDRSSTCKAWSDVRELMVGERRPLVKRRRGSDTESTRSRWMAGLKMPAIPVEDDPRVLRVFEFYTQNPVGRETFQSMLFRCGAYRDLIQSTLIRYDLPPDLMALVFTESGCEPSAKSPVGAAGLWQFMPETGRAYHLRIVEGTIDERYSPFKSTEAGIRMLADLRQKLGSWDLVFASYNLGPFGVLARVARAGGDATFWDLVDADLLPDETANYAPSVQAIALILANLQRLKFAGIQIGAPQSTADLEVPGGTRLGLVARAAATSVTQLRALNLDFSGDTVPLIPGGAIAVQVPKDVVWQARDSLKELLTSHDRADLCVPPSFNWGKQRFTPDMDAACQRRLASGSFDAH